MTPPTKAESKHHILQASISSNKSTFTTANIKQLTIFFELKNVTSKTVNPEIPATVLVIDDRVYRDSAWMFSNGPRDARFKALPPNDTLSFSYVLDDVIKTSGEHKIVWRGANQNDALLKISVKPDHK
ncbi:MAG TPA: hypothetical protein V6C76_12975 [Drouetiella sp.]